MMIGINIRLRRRHVMTMNNKCHGKTYTLGTYMGGCFQHIEHTSESLDVINNALGWKMNSSTQNEHLETSSQFIGEKTSENTLSKNAARGTSNGFIIVVLQEDIQFFFGEAKNKASNWNILYDQFITVVHWEWFIFGFTSFLPLIYRNWGKFFPSFFGVVTFPRMHRSEDGPRLVL